MFFNKENPIFSFYPNIDIIHLTKSRKKCMEELAEYLMKYKFEIADTIIKEDFKFIKFKNKYTFYNERISDLYVVKTNKLTEENYQLMLEDRESIKKIMKDNISVIYIVFVNEYNDIFDKYLREFFYIDFYPRKSKFSSVLLNIGICFKNESIHIGTLSKDTGYGRGKSIQKQCYNLVKAFNEGKTKLNNRK